MRRYAIPLLVVALLFSAPLRAEPVTCCNQGEIATLRTLADIARAGAPPEIAGRLLNFIQTVTSPESAANWGDPDRGLILGYMVATGDGVYWRSLVEDFARSIRVTIKPVGPGVQPPAPPPPLPPAPPPGPSPVVVVPPAPPAPSGGGAITLDNPPELTLRNTLGGTRFDIGIFLSRNDNGLRVMRNWCFIGYESFCDPYQPQTGIAIEQDGAISFSGRQAFVNPVGRWDYPNSGKSFVFQPAGFCGSVNFCKNVWIGIPSKGRGLEIGTNDPSDPNPDARDVKAIFEEGGVSVFIEGKGVRRLYICPGTTNTVCVESEARTAKRRAARKK